MKKAVVLLFILVAGSLLHTSLAIAEQVKTDKAALDKKSIEKTSTGKSKSKTIHRDGRYCCRTLRR